MAEWTVDINFDITKFADKVGTITATYTYDAGDTFTYTETKKWTGAAITAFEANALAALAEWDPMRTAKLSYETNIAAALNA